MAVVTSYIPTNYINAVTRYYICDLYTELPSDNGIGDLAFAKDTNKLYYATAPGVWSATAAGGFSLTSGCITSGYLGDGAVVSGSMASGQIGQYHLASGVGGGLSSGQVTSGYLGNAAVVSGSIASGQIGQYHLASGVGGSALSSGQVTSGYLGDGAVVSGSIASGQIGVEHLASGLVSGNWIPASASGVFFPASASGIWSGSTWYSGSIASGQIGTYHLASGTIPDSIPSSASGLFYPANQSGVWIDGAISGSWIPATASGLFFPASASGIWSGSTWYSGSIASGQIGTYHLAAGALTTYNLLPGASGSVVSGTIASGQIGTYHLSSGIIISQATSLTPIISGRSIIAGEPISGGRAVTFGTSGNIVLIAMASVQARMPAAGIVMDNVASGIQVNVYTGGHLQFPQSTGMVDYSGYISKSVYVGRSGQIVSSSGSYNSGGLLSGDFIQSLGLIANSGGLVVNIGSVFTDNLIASGDIASGQIGILHLASGVLVGGQSYTVAYRASGYTTTSTDDYVFISGSPIITAGTAVGRTRPLIFKNVNAGTGTINAQSGQTIEALSSQVVTANCSMMLISDNSNWWIV